MNKEDVLHEYDYDGTLGVNTEEIYKAMDQYAKQQCIVYGHWLLKRLFPHMTPVDPTQPEADDLYTLFLTTQH